ncbi:MAG: 30S ribosomal protein S6e [Candidatus Hadarchaeum sp.]|uniref:30S ribosomal protein S6e n=1 Tax=Candidatus Hadarchaeum sp. TaxID=2883567 RepID=UPI003175D1F1
MPFKMVVADPKTGRSYKLEAREPEARKLIGFRIGDKFDGGVVGLPGYELQITGGTDRDGFPMRPDIAGSGRASVLLARGPGFSPKRPGERRRKMVRGSRVSEDIVQLNVVITKWGEKPVEEIIQPKETKQG